MSAAARLALLLIGGYQRLSRYFPRHCRFHPTCSEYARQAIAWHGLLRGSWLAGGRLLRCQPLHPGGLDPVPYQSDVRAPSELLPGGR